MTERPPQPAVGVKRLYPWYSDWRILEFTCEHCGWTGKGEKTCPNEGGVLECPRCDRGVAYVQFPNLRDMEQAAAEGNEEAIQDLPKKREWIRRTEERMNRFESNHLHSLEQLPELDGESLEFTWDFKQHVGTKMRSTRSSGLARSKSGENWLSGTILRDSTKSKTC